MPFSPALVLLIDCFSCLSLSAWPVWSEGKKYLTSLSAFFLRSFYFGISEALLRPENANGTIFHKRKSRIPSELPSLNLASHLCLQLKIFSCCPGVKAPLEQTSEDTKNVQESKKIRQVSKIIFSTSSLLFIPRLHSRALLASVVI